MTNFRAGTLSDIASGRVVEQIRVGHGFLGDANVDAAEAGGSTWVSWFDGGILCRD